MSARDAIGWGTLGAGLCAALVLGVQGLSRTGGAAGSDHETSAAADEAGSKGERTNAVSGSAVTADAALQARLGIRTAPLAAASIQAQSHGLARGLDAGPLAAIEAEISTARGAALASAAEAQRLAALAAADQSASRQSVEAARAQATADAARLKLAEQRVSLEFGPGLGVMSDATRRGLLTAITRGEAALVRVDLPTGSTASTVRLATGGAIRLIGPAAQADAKLQSAGQLGIAYGVAARQLNNGRVLDVLAGAGPEQSGVLVPATAVVRWRGGQWVYRAAQDKFARVELIDAQPVPGGWLAGSGLSPGDAIVVDGAGALLAIDRADDLAQGGE